MITCLGTNWGEDAYKESTLHFIKTYLVDEWELQSALLWHVE